MSSADGASRRVDQSGVAAFLRGLAAQAERDAAFAATLGRLLDEAGLLSLGAPADRQRRAAKRAAPRSAESPLTADLPDPFSVWRESGDAGLRARLETLDLAALRQIIRAHRFDPARISARWTARDRLVSLIVEQTRARVNHGKAFTHV